MELGTLNHGVGCKSEYDGRVREVHDVLLSVTLLGCLLTMKPGSTA